MTDRLKTRRFLPKRILTDREKLWLKLNYPHLGNALCALHLNMGKTALWKFAKELGLQKSDEFKEQTIRMRTEKAHKSRMAHGVYPTKGVYNENLKKGKEYWFKSKET